jgi:hypothetical protein
MTTTRPTATLPAMFEVVSWDASIGYRSYLTFYLNIAMDGCHILVMITTALNKIHVYMPNACTEIIHNLSSVYFLLCLSIFELER